MKILVIQLRQLGDVLMTTPSLRAIKRSAPANVIHFLVRKKCVSAILGNPDADRVIRFEDSGFGALAWALRRERYDAVIDFQGLPATAILTRFTGARMRIGTSRRFRGMAYTHAFPPVPGPLYAALDKARLLAPLSLTVADCSLTVPSGPEQQAEALALASQLGLNRAHRTAAFSPVSRREYKRWPFERYAALCDALHARHGFRLLPLFGPGEEPFVEEVLACSRTREAFLYPYKPPSFSALLPLLRNCSFYFGNDNGIRHVAIAAGLPTATVFGTPDPRDWTPPADPRHRWLWGREEMESIATETFFEEIEKLLHENRIV